jgi:L,D-peptidoglycan transpeptidase YkuD (ErfK/YbiS/YcfS/YnhG family)
MSDRLPKQQEHKTKRILLVAITIGVVVLAGGLGLSAYGLSRYQNQQTEIAGVATPGTGLQAAATDTTKQTIEEETVAEQPVAIEQPAATAENERPESTTGIESIIAGSPSAGITDQIIAVVANGTYATVYLLEKNGDRWETVLSTEGRVGTGGVGPGTEYAPNTPIGSYGLSLAFGTGGNPGAQLPYRQITGTSYWISTVDDPDYNTWQERDWSSSVDEHLADSPGAYQYGIALDYNGGYAGGSAFFLHCPIGRATEGCITVPTDVMQQLITRIHVGARIINVNSLKELAYY